MAVGYHAMIRHHGNNEIMKLLKYIEIIPKDQLLLGLGLPGDPLFEPRWNSVDSEVCGQSWLGQGMLAVQPHLLLGETFVKPVDLATPTYFGLGGFRTR